MKDVLEPLGELMKEVAEREILPRWKHLAEGDIISKATPTDPSDLVTIADRAAEVFLTARLPALVPGSVVVGEEAVAQTPSVLDALDGDAPVWLVDPIDGTRNFAAGSGPFGVMIALVERGELVLSGIYLPLERELYLAERGAGVTLNGQRFHARPAGSAVLTGTLDHTVPTLTGTVYQRLMPEAVRASLNERPENVRFAESPQCAATEYTAMARGDRDFALYYRLHPWDHAPGALILREAGGVARHPDGHEYSASSSEPLMLITPDLERWQRARRALFL